MQSSCWLCMQLGPPKVIEISTLVLSPTLAPAPPFRGSGSPAQPHCISCSHREVHHLLMSRPSSLAHTENFITCSCQDLHLFAHTKTLISSLRQDLRLFLTPRPLSLGHIKSFISCSHRERCGLDTQSQARLNPIPTTVSTGSYPPTLLFWR